MEQLAIALCAFFLGTLVMGLWFIAFDGEHLWLGYILCLVVGIGLGLL